MLKIGVFSQLAQVTIKTLHHYARLDLLKPIYVDPESGYRFYEVGQMARLNRILALKDLGFSLEQVAHLLDEDLPATEIRGMLKLRQTELEHEMSELQASLGRVEARLSQIEREGMQPRFDVIIKDVKAQRILSLREKLETPSDIKPFFLAVARALSRNGIKAVGPWLSIYHHEAYREEDLDVESAIPVDKTVKGPIPLADGRSMTIRELPAYTMATVICCRTCQSDVFEANLALCKWISNQETYDVIDAPCREAYAEAPQEGQPVVFEIQLPVGIVQSTSSMAQK